MNTTIFARNTHRAVLHGVIFTLACLTFVGGYFGTEITWLMVGG